MPAPPSASLPFPPTRRWRSKEYSRFLEQSRSVRAPAWLTVRPIAHRGLHDAARGIIENMPAAAQAAIAGNFSIECDIQLTSDGEAMVHHDDALGRRTQGDQVQGCAGADDVAQRSLRAGRRPRAAGDRGQKPL